jgi:hypothetical protein
LEVLGVRRSGDDLRHCAMERHPSRWPSLCMLTEAYCGPGVASGWGYLAMLGAVFFAFEAVSYLLRKVAQGVIL